LEIYSRYLSDAGFITAAEKHDEALLDLVNQVRSRLLGAEIAVALKKLDLPGVDFASARAVSKAAWEAVRQGKLGYSLMWGQRKPASISN
jgi:hypothetical protein